ncbi:hypothetical protein [Curtobacterium sp. MCBA15_008]|uniref:hypothetical protein n=1 Tax=Curtobacterium sp. MCBA15_008 TaxID=1898736 RepID=UPI001113461A|nr:hypothetical protein [Curtobacterium sp. MCBA15_008]
MQPLVARCLLIGTSLVLVAVGVVAPLTGLARTILLVAAACCAVLDVLLVRSARAGDGSSAAVVLGPPPTPASPHPDDEPSGIVNRAAPEPAPHTVTFGTGPDGHAVELPVGSVRAHVVVVGTGALAHAVYRALAVQVLAIVEQDAAVVRSAAAPDLEDLDGFVIRADPPRNTSSREGARAPAPASARPTSVWAPEPPTAPSSPRLPPGTAVLAADPHASTPTTLVLVPGLSLLPRRFDVVVEVTRYGCTVRRRDDSRDDRRGVPIAPALPQIDLT